MVITLFKIIQQVLIKHVLYVKGQNTMFTHLVNA